MKKYKRIFISDIHLSQHDHKTLEKFDLFCSNFGSSTDELYIMGDLFEYWIGDNCMESWHLSIANKIKKISSNGTKIFFIAGNRDFLIGKKFAKFANFKILKDPYILDIINKKTILSHGDMFCTNDKTYQIYRKFAQNFITKGFLSVTPKSIKLKLANMLKRKDSEHNKPLSKSEEVKYDTSKNTLAKIMTKYESLDIIHGHTHLPKIHSNKIKASNKFLFAKRYVLGDWQARNPIFLVEIENSLQLTRLIAS